jgi:hypothetical protein
MIPYLCGIGNPIFAYFRVSKTFQIPNGPNLFSTSFFKENESKEKKKSTWNATR